MANKSDDNMGCITTFVLGTMVSVIVVVGSAVNWKVAGIVAAAIVVVVFVVPVAGVGLLNVWNYFKRRRTAREK